jgi:hypothetical protein
MTSFTVDPRLDTVRQTKEYQGIVRRLGVRA